MDTKNEQRLFAVALQIMGAGERESFLKKACGNDADLYSHLVHLLSLRDQSERFFSDCIQDPDRNAVENRQAKNQ